MGIGTRSGTESVGPLSQTAITRMPFPRRLIGMQPERRDMYAKRARSDRAPTYVHPPQTAALVMPQKSRKACAPSGFLQFSVSGVSPVLYTAGFAEASGSPSCAAGSASESSLSTRIS